MSGRSGLALTAAVLLLALQGCSGEQSPGGGADRTDTGEVGRDFDRTPDLTPEEQAYADAVVPEFRQQTDLSLTKPQARCFAENVVDLLGVDAFHAVGSPQEAASVLVRFDLRPFSVTGTQAKQVVGLFAGCGVDVFDAFLRSLQAVVGDQAVTCVSDEVTPREYEEFLERQMAEGMVFARSGPDGELGAGGERARSPEQVTWGAVTQCVVPPN